MSVPSWSWSFAGCVNSLESNQARKAIGQRLFEDIQAKARENCFLRISGSVVEQALSNLICDKPRCLDKSVVGITIWLVALN